MFARLNASARNCARNPSVTAKFLNNDMSNCENDGPSSRLRPTFPNVPRSGRRHGPSVCPLAVSGVTRPSAASGVVTNHASRGLIVRLPLAHQIRPAPAGVAVGVAIAVAWRERQSALPRVDGAHLPAADDRAQRPACVARDICGPLPNGSSHTPFRPNTWLRWLSFGP